MNDLDGIMKKLLEKVFPGVRIEVRFVGQGCSQTSYQFACLADFLIARLGQMEGLRLAGIRVLQPGVQDVELMLLRNILGIDIEALWRSFFQEKEV
jgi:hypothetical protein